MSAAAALLVAAGAAATGGGACSNWLDCSLNGDCAGSPKQCVCDPGWTGETCAVLNLAPAQIEHSYVAPEGTSSWGMSVVEDQSAGKPQYHGYVSEFALKCKLSSWTSNSYVNHIVADAPTGPWRQAGQALSEWAHNPKVIYDAKEGVYAMYHIGSASGGRSLKNCTTGAALTTAVEPRTSAVSPAPFSIHYSKSLAGPWTPLTDIPSPDRTTGGNKRMTLYPGVSNIDVSVPAGGVLLREQPAHGNGTLLVNFSTFVRKAGVLEWDACGGAVFDNGHPVEQTGVGSRIGSFSVVGDGAVQAGNPCAVEWPSTPTLRGPFAASDGVQTLSIETNYFRLPDAGGPASSARAVGDTQDAAGCRGVCETTADCISFTWDGRDRAAGEGGTCWVRNDTLWWPNVTNGDPARLAAGRPWTFDGDNPAPLIDAARGNVTVLYRTDIGVGVGASPMASLIGIATAPSWRGPYSLAGDMGGSLTNAQYPFDENEDPFLWQTPRGFHALFHSNTWGDSRHTVHPVAQYAGRLAFSADGVRWRYSEVPPYNGTIRWANGTESVFSRVERPVLLFADGRPTHLINGAQRYSNDDYTFTLVRTVA